MGELAYINVDPWDVKAGDIATHVEGNLDSREVTQVDENGGVWLWLLTREAGPFPIENYTFKRRVTD